MESSEQAVGLVAGVLVAAFAALLTTGYAVHRLRVNAFRMRAFDFLAEMNRMAAAGEIDVDAQAEIKTPREIKRGHVVLIDSIGAGAFGEVWKGTLDESAAGGVPGYVICPGWAEAVGGGLCCSCIQLALSYLHAPRRSPTPSQEAGPSELTRTVLPRIAGISSRSRRRKRRTGLGPKTCAKRLR